MLKKCMSILYRYRKVAKKKISKTSNMVVQKMYIDLRVLHNNTAHLAICESWQYEKRMTSFHKEGRFGPIQLINPVTYFEMPLPNHKVSCHIYVCWGWGVYLFCFFLRFSPRILEMFGQCGISCFAIYFCTSWNLYWKIELNCDNFEDDSCEEKMKEEKIID